MKRFNARLPLILALSMCAGIFIGIVLFLYGLSAAWIAMAAFPSALAFLFLAKSAKKFLKPALFVLLSCIFFVIGATNCFFALKRYSCPEISPGEYYYIQGTVTEKGETARGGYAILGDLKFNGQKVGGKMNLYLSPTYGELCDVGYTVEFYGAPDIEKPFEYGKLNSFAEENIKYSAAVYGGLTSSYRLSLTGAIRSSLRDRLFGNLSGETAAVTFAMLTGNTQYMSEQSLNTFRYGGIAHIFAVSGLHVGIIFAILTFICKKLKINKYVSAAVCLAFIAFYVAVCGFTLSSVRAAIMCAVATFAKLSLQKYDGLNSLSLAATVILVITPLSLFSAGFQLSVCATGGIFALSKLYSKFFKKLKLPKKACSAAGVSLGAQTATFPVLLAKFGYVSGAGLLLNIFVLPALSAIFSLIFAAALVCLVIPPLSPFLLPYAALPLELFMSLAYGLGFEKSLISGFGAGFFVPLYFAGALFLSDKINIKLKTRIVATCVSAAVLISYVLSMYAYPAKGFNVIVSAYGAGGEVIVKSQSGTLLVVTDDINADRLKQTLNEHYITDIDVLVILGKNGADNLLRLGIDCREIRLNESDSPVQPYSGYTLIYESCFTACGTACRFFDDGTLLVTCGGISVGICGGDNFAMPDCDILITDVKNSFVGCREEIYLNNACGSLNVFERGDISIRIQDGDFAVKTTLPPHLLRRQSFICNIFFLSA